MSGGGIDCEPRGDEGVCDISRRLGDEKAAELTYVLNICFSDDVMAVVLSDG